MKSVMRTVLSLACLLWFGSTALAAEPRTLRLGHMELVYDAQRWIAERSNDNLVTMRPIGAIAERHGPVSVSRKPSDGIDSCEGLARIELPEWLYRPPTRQAVEVAGLAALRFVAHTRCRNLTPQGVVICIHNRGSAFLLTLNMVNCGDRFGNRFSRTDRLQELIGGIRFP
jgi:hypothetical protein